MVEQALVPAESRTQDLAVQAVVRGDLRKFSEAEKLEYIGAVCRSLGLNPLTRPFELIVLNGREVLYPTRGATDQLRSIRGVTITDIRSEQIGDIYKVTAFGRDRDGREDAATGAVAIRGLQGEALANALMKAETKAKRRLTLSLAGLGWPDESEIEDIPPAVEQPVRKTLAEKVAERAAALEETAETEPETVDGEVVEEAASAQQTAQEPVQCEATDESPMALGRCAKAAGHAGGHRSHEGTWA